MRAGSVGGGGGRWTTRVGPSGTVRLERDADDVGGDIGAKGSRTRWEGGGGRNEVNLVGTTSCSRLIFGNSVGFDDGR